MNSNNIMNAGVLDVLPNGNGDVVIPGSGGGGLRPKRQIANGLYAVEFDDGSVVVVDDNGNIVG